MLIGITGNLGSGKTLSGVILANFLRRMIGAEVRSNMLKMKGATPFWDMQEVWNMENSILLWDEMWITADSRMWKSNVAMTDFIMLTRKKGLILIYTAQKFGQLDKRIRDVTDYVIVCDKRKEGIWMSFIDTYDERRGRRYLIPHPEQFYSLYDTLEIPHRIK